MQFLDSLLRAPTFLLLGLILGAIAVIAGGSATNGGDIAISNALGLLAAAFVVGAAVLKRTTTPGPVQS